MVGGRSGCDRGGPHHLGADRFANFIADQVFKIAAAMVPEGFESFRIEVLGVSPGGSR